MWSMVIGFTPAFAVQVNHRGTVHEQLATHIQRQLVHLYWVRTHVRYRQRATIDDFHVAQNFNALIKVHPQRTTIDYEIAANSQPFRIDSGQATTLYRQVSGSDQAVIGLESRLTHSDAIRGEVLRFVAEGFIRPAMIFQLYRLNRVSGRLQTGIATHILCGDL